MNPFEEAEHRNPIKHTSAIHAAFHKLVMRAWKQLFCYSERVGGGNEAWKQQSYALSCLIDSHCYHHSDSIISAAYGALLLSGMNDDHQIMIQMREYLNDSPYYKIEE